MPINHTFSLGHAGGSVPLSDTVTVTGTVAAEVNVSLAAATTNQLAALGYVSANVKGVYIKSSADVTIRVDSTGSPEQTIVIKAGVPYVWYANSPAANLLATDCGVGWYLSCTLAAEFYARVLN